MTERHSMRHRYVDDFLLVVHGNEPASAEDWAAMMVTVESRTTRIAGMFVLAPPKASINAGQRSDVHNFMRAARGPAAVLTSSKMARGAVTALSWFGIKIRAFEPSKTAEALAYLGCSAEQRHNVKMALREMEAELEHAPPTSARNATA